MLIDTHCHMNIIIRGYKTKTELTPLSPQEFDQCLDIINQAKENNVTHIINVGTDLIESITCINIAKNFNHVYATIGLHPNDATQHWQKDIDAFKDLLSNKETLKIIGIGECGIDTHYPNYNLDLQKKVFHAQIKLALEHNLPLSIHSRDADEQTYQALADYKGEKNFRGTIHCFSSNELYAQKYIDLGFVLGFGGTVTYPKNEILRNVAKEIPLEKIILETDAPFLPPQIIRGKQNTPAQIKNIAEFIAELKNESFHNVTTTTSQTTKKLFNID